MNIQIGVFYQIADYPGAEPEFTFFKVPSESSRKAFEDIGYVFWCMAEVEFVPPTRAQAVAGQCQALVDEIARKRADCEAACTHLDGRKNRLLELEYTPSEKPPVRRGPVPRAPYYNATDVEPRDDNEPF